MESKNIIKALECCSISDYYDECRNCFYAECDSDKGCIAELCEDALNLIKNQQAEIEKLNENYQSLIAQEEKSNQYCKNVCEPKYKAEIKRLQQNLKEAHIDIKEHMAEIERLKELLEEWKTEAYKVADEKDELYCNAVERVTIARNEAYKEFAKKVNENRLTYFNYIYSDDGFANITNNIYKELTEKGGAE